MSLTISPQISQTILITKKDVKKDNLYVDASGVNIFLLAEDVTIFREDGLQVE
jgi:hypothetical protein